MSDICEKGGIVWNAIRTPDGTVLESLSVHDYKTYVDANGHEYMVDGGTCYLRRNLVPEAPFEELSLYAEDPIEELREVCRWGSYGKNGDEPLKVQKIKELSDNHLQAILDNCGHIGHYRTVLEREKEYRKGLDK